MKRNYILMLWALLCLARSYGATIYVTPTGSGNGTSWATAYGSLVTALQNAQSGDEIWVKQGTYKPSETLNAGASFIFKNGVKVYGGFAGTEATLAARADATGTTTILSGYLSAAVRSKTILKVTNALSTLNLLDGFTIRDASHTLNGFLNSGAGVRVVSSKIEFKNVHITNNSMTMTNVPSGNNSDSIAGGAGLYSRLSDIKLRNVTIANNSFTLSNNTAVASGPQGGAAGLFVYKGKINFKKGSIDNNVLTNNNYMAFGGGAYLAETDSIYIEAVGVKNNRIEGSGGAGAGLYLTVNAKVKLVNNIFHNNFGLYGQKGNAVKFMFTTATIVNNTFGRNNTIGVDPAPYSIDIYYSTLRFDNCAFLERFFLSDAGNSIVYNRCITKYNIEQGVQNNVTTQVMDFIDPLNGNYTPKSCSAYLNMGNNAYNTATTDINGNPRVAGNTIDFGAIELQNQWTNRVYVDVASANTVKDGTSWATAFTDLHDALNCGCNVFGVTTHPTEVWVAQGTYRLPQYEPANTYALLSFELKNNQAVYGGFVSGATTLEERDTTWLEHPTILSGVNNGLHVYNVIKALNTNETAKLDGFIIQDGGATGGFGMVTGSGPGILVQNGRATLKNLWVRNNDAPYIGGGILFYEAGADADNLKVTDNTSGQSGGGIAFFEATVVLQPGEVAQPNVPSIFTNIEISDNVSLGGGGGLYVEKNYVISVRDFKINNNTSRTMGGGAALSGATVSFLRGTFDQNTCTDATWTSRGGAIYADAVYGGSLSAESVVFSGNVSKEGGVLNMGALTANFVNCTFADNEATVDGNFAYFNNGTVITIKNSIILSPDNGLQSVIKYPPSAVVVPAYVLEKSLINDTFSPLFAIAANVITNTDPQFVDAENANYQLVACGPAVDAGLNSYLSLSPLTDALGNARVKNSLVDLGAYEFQYIDLVYTTQPEDVTVNTGATATFTVETENEAVTLQWQVSTNNGTTWTNISGANGTTLTINPVTAANNNNLYRCVMTDCGGSAASNPGKLTVSGVSGLEDVSLPGLMVYPNPAAGHFTIAYAGATSAADITVYDVQGRKIYQNSFTAAQLQEGAKVDASPWSSGVYRIQWHGEQHTTVAFIKN